MYKRQEHELRGALDDQLLAMVARLRTEQATQDRVDELVQEVITDELLREWIGRWWTDVRRMVHLAAQEGAEGVRLRTSLVDAVVSAGHQLQDDERWRQRAQQLLEGVAAPVADIGQREVGGMIESTVERWDAEDTSRRLELWLGRDLQFVRINGTVVGALVGLVLHTITQTL